MGRPKKSGRRKGQPNYEYVEVVAIPPACPMCRSTNLERLGGSVGVPQTMIYTGTYQGQRYDRITWKRSRCRDCGQRITLRILEENRKALSKTAEKEVESTEGQSLE